MSARQGLLILVSLFALGACGRAPIHERDLVGVWTGVWRLDGDDTHPNWEFALSLALREGGRCTLSFPLIGDVPTEVRERQTTPPMDARWSVEGKVVTVTVPPLGEEVVGSLRIVVHGEDDELNAAFTLSDGELVRHGESRTGKPGAWRLVRQTPGHE